ncbi:hypothetical protein C1645_823006 [Glomus cerebriforme]|uniref:Uncharacterized protein n=1 Tax=Glomus cerebriforme TaxID=658196 RepID=A0A397SWX6_9GLOM|nr:hypothetical protein C1645_823006 [Glomus cerebriforme]
MKRRAAPLTDNEKLMVINIYNYFLGDNLRKDDHQKLSLYKQVAKVLGIAEGTVRSIILDWNKHGEHKNILHELPNNVAFCCHYLCFHFANLEGNNDMPRYPEVFLDESYCHLYHTSRNTWVSHQGIILAPRHGPLVVIFGAIIVFQNRSSNKLHSELVLNSVYIRDVIIKPSGNLDYHENFNAEIFKNLFTNFCKILSEDYGSVSIHIDGASYHKWRAENIPSSSAKKQELID